MSSVAFIEIGASVVVLTVFLFGLVFDAESRWEMVGWSLGVVASGVSVWMETPLGEAMAVGYAVAAGLFVLTGLVLFTAGGPIEG